MLKKLLLLFFICLYSLGFAQKEANIWMIERGNGLDFFDDTARFYGGCKLGDNETSSSICDKDGNLLFYTNGIVVYNRFHKLVKNGTGLGFPLTQNESTSFQGSLILKHPLNDSIMYIFSTDYRGQQGGLVYSELSIHRNNDSGLILKKKIRLTSNVNESIQAINHQNGVDIWIITHGYGNSTFNKFLITKNGLSNCLKTQNIGFFHSTFSGSGAQSCSKFSSNGNQFIHIDFNREKIEILKFNSENSLFSTQNKLFDVKGGVYFAEFSPNGKLIYLVYPDSLLQLNIEKRSFIKIGNNNSYTQLQMAKNGKIYGSIQDSVHLIEISSPNTEGKFCNFFKIRNFFSNSISTSLPNFNQSYFYTPAIDYSYQLDCRSNTIELWGKDTFNGNKFQWGLRKLYSNDTFALISTAINTSYSFSDTGSVQVRFIAANSTRTDTALKTLIIYPKVNQHFLGKDTVFASGSIFTKTLASPPNAFCNRWFYKDSLVSSSDSLQATKFGTYTCQSSNQSFCSITDTLVIRPCADTLSVPIILRSRDTLMVSNYSSDSLVWVLNGMAVQKGYKNYYHFKDTGTFYVVLHRALNCPKSSSAFAIKTLCIDTLKTPIISRSRDSLFVVNYQTDSLFWFKNGQLVQASKQNNFHMGDTGNYSVEVHRPFHCTKTSQPFAVNSVCIDSLKRPIISQINDSLFVANMKADSLKWYKNGVFLSISSEAYLNINDTGLYTVEAYKRFLCAKTSLAFKVNKLNIAVNEWLTKQVNIFPNPSEGELTIQCTQDFKLKVVDAIGKLLFEQDNLKTLELPKGIYTFYITIAGGTVVKKVVVL